MTYQLPPVNLIRFLKSILTRPQPFSYRYLLQNRGTNKLTNDMCRNLLGATVLIPMNPHFPKMGCTITQMTNGVAQVYKEVRQADRSWC